jgi:hypothetical protein
MIGGHNGAVVTVDQPILVNREVLCTTTREILHLNTAPVGRV